MKRLLLVLCLLCLCFTGCASWNNDIAASGGLFGTYKGNYVVISQSGGEIVDVWILTDVFVESVHGSDGWRFIDGSGNVTFIGGDVKATRIKNRNDLWKYHEYHIEFESESYQSKFNKKKVTQWNSDASGESRVGLPSTTENGTTRLGSTASPGETRSPVLMSCLPTTPAFAVSGRGLTTSSIGDSLAVVVRSRPEGLH